MNQWINESVTKVGIELLGQLKTTDLGDDATPYNAMWRKTSKLPDFAKNDNSNAKKSTLKKSTYILPLLYLYVQWNCSYMHVVIQVWTFSVSSLRWRWMFRCWCGLNFSPWITLITWHDEQKQQRNKRCNINSQALLEKKLTPWNQFLPFFCTKFGKQHKFWRFIGKPQKRRAAKNANKKFENFPKVRARKFGTGWEDSAWKV